MFTESGLEQIIYLQLYIYVEPFYLISVFLKANLSKYVLLPEVKFLRIFFEIWYKCGNSSYVRIFVPERKRYNERQNHSTVFSIYVVEESTIRSIKLFSFFPSFSIIFQYLSLETLPLDGSHTAIENDITYYELFN